MKIIRPNIIDVEASGFGPESYPIEIGFVTTSRKRYSTLIMPHENWNHWDPESARIHNITRDLLNRHGRPLGEVAEYLNKIFKGETVYSDGWVVDKPWIDRLFYEANAQRLFSVSPLELILKEDQMEIWHRIKIEVIKQLKAERHRASIDAYVIQETFVRSRKILSDHQGI
ncbi:hypothetical protein [Desulfamplus magnetovallimortis]|nr:hypothetical protein [Desulfamplus magnetovallimortis]